MRIMIIGGGVIGLLSALELAWAGCDVIVLERGRCGRESSWAGGGIVSPLYPWRYSPAVTALASLAQAAYPRLGQRLRELTGIDIELSACGMLMLDAEDGRDALVWGRQYGQAVHALDGAQVRELAPLLGGFTTGLWLPQVANVRNPRLMQALRQALPAAGVTCIEEADVTGWRVEGARVRAVHCADGRELEADQFVAATGAWSGALLGALGRAVPVKPMKGQMLLYKLPEQVLGQIVLHQGHYLIPRRDGHILCGSTLEDTGFDQTTSVEAHAVLKAAAERLLPLLADIPVVGHWAGLRPASPNGIPFIGRDPVYANLWVNAGQFRNGLVLAPASARLLADLMLGRPCCVAPEPYQLV